MKITVLNGSPKGELSVTLQYVRFVEKKLPAHKFKVFHIACDIGKIEKDEKAFASIIKGVKDADAVLWAFPLYVFLVPSQYKRFIEMIFERKAESAFLGKYTAALSTSIHFYDHTAHNYLRGICDDLGMHFVESFSADMDDLFSADMRKSLLGFADNLLQAAEMRLPTVTVNEPIAPAKYRYRPGGTEAKVDAAGKKVLVVADIDDEKTNTAKMVRRFAAVCPGAEIVTLNDIAIKGGCLGCVQCAFDNDCVYGGNDGYVKFFNEKLKKTDVTVFAGAIRDRFLSARFKMFLDRAFFNGHVPISTGKQMGYLVSGPLRQLPNVRQIMEAEAELAGANLVDIVTDECADDKVLDALIDDLARRCMEFSRRDYVRPQSFLGVGGHKLFRDAIWARMRFPFDADYKYYKKHGLFDFPQKDKRYLDFSKQMIAMIKDPKMRAIVRKVAKQEMVRPFREVVDTK